MDIEEFEKKVTPSAKRSRLEPFRVQIFELKVKGYADWQVRDWLATNGLEISRQAVQQFIKKGQEEKRFHAFKTPTQGTSPAAAPQVFTPRNEEETGPIGDDLSGLDKKQRREKRADQFIKPELTNALLSKILKDKKP